MPARLEPIREAERYSSLDLLRGFALFGVLIVNLLYFFRVSLFEHMLHFHSHDGWANRAIDVLVAVLIEFKAFNLFSMTFGIGVAIQAERAGLRGAGVMRFLLRRFAILLVFGLCHLFLISNVDILTLYAVCGLLLIPFLRLPVAVLALAGLVAVYLPPLLPRGPIIPPMDILQAHAAAASRIYSEGNFGEILAFRWRETQEMVAPLLIGSAQKTFGLMLLGVAVWRLGVIRKPQQYRAALWAVCAGCATVGLINSIAAVFEEVERRETGIPWQLQLLGSHVPLAFAYGAALLAWRPSRSALALTAPVAAVGRMALSNYLMQSLMFAFLFYGWGFGLFGKLAPVPAAAIGVAFYFAQLGFSRWWLGRYRFGPFEWLWRSLTYGRWQPLLCQSELDTRREFQ